MRISCEITEKTFKQNPDYWIKEIGKTKGIDVYKMLGNYDLTTHKKQVVIHEFRKTEFIKLLKEFT